MISESFQIFENHDFSEIFHILEAYFVKDVILSNVVLLMSFILPLSFAWLIKFTRRYELIMGQNCQKIDYKGQSIMFENILDSLQPCVFLSLFLSVCFARQLIHTVNVS